MNKKFTLHLFLFLAILVFVFRSLVLNISTNLIDWLDYPFVVWIFSQNIDKLLSLDFAGFFDTNILFPHKNTLLLAENLIAPSLLALPFTLFSNNLILNFNLVFFLTFILNYLSSYLLWKLIFKKHSLAFIGALFLTFSPLFHTELSHFQIVSFWPFIFSLYFLIKNSFTNRLRDLVYSGIFLAIQFLTSAYVAVFLIFTILAFYFIKFLFENDKISILKKPLIILGLFLLIDAFVIEGYVETRSLYNINRTYSEAITYSAHISDYIFTTGIDSLLHNSIFMQKWNSFNKHPGPVFPGFLITGLAALSLFSLKWKKKHLTLDLNIKKEYLFFFILMLAGLVFSFGPRANFNNIYGHIPLPYHLIWKYVPVVSSIRVPARWSFLFYFGIIFFALNYLSKKNLKKLLIIVFILFLIEYIPINLQTTSQNYLREKDHILQDVCNSDKRVVLEIPVTHFDASGGIVKGLNYISKTQLASSYHDCYLVNGYTGHDHPSLLKLKEDIYQAARDDDFELFMQIVQQTKADIISINEESLLDENKEGFVYIKDQLKKSSKTTQIGEGLYQINK